MLVVTSFVYFILVKIFDKYVLGIVLKATITELKQYEEK